MQATATFGYEQIVTEQIRGILDTVADKPGLTPERKATAQQTVVCSVMAYNPRDPVETMLAGQCIVYDHMLRDGARDMLRGQAELIKIKARPGILSTGKMFLSTMEMLSRMQGRAADQLAFARQPEAQEDPAAKPADPANDAAQDEPIAARSPARPSDAGPSIQAAAPRPAAENPPDARPAPPESPATASARVAPGPPTASPPPTHQGATPAQARGAIVAPLPDRATPNRPPGSLSAPRLAARTLLSDEAIENILLKGLDPAQQQEIRDAVTRTTQGAG